MEYFLKSPGIDLDSTFNCGQCFRWKKAQDGSYSGFAGAHRATVRQVDGGLMLSEIHESDKAYWGHYFDTQTNYAALIRQFAHDPTLRAATAYAPGIRVLRQEPFETLISFIISQNNNIGRISGIIETLCELFGSDGAFPTAGAFGALTEADLSPLRAGYRTRYILDAAKKVNDGEIRLDNVAKMQYNIAKAELLKIVGVGDKVADCVLLFGFGKMQAFPKDVWVKRVMSRYYPDGLPDCTRGVEGIAQQFLFHYIRMIK
ncbi:MAG: DNA-3-methyladenine glycosylase 2 [Oscillospiraceae bacterium]|nr:DNA-3-methyladenine glycosylase 2 [Oscillospiraceae bacterium]